MGTALITGGDGFIGSHLRRALAGRGLEALAYKGDVRELAHEVRAASILFHLAAKTSEQSFIDNPAEAYDINVIGTLSAVRYCARHAASMILVSTSGVYAPTAEGYRISETEAVRPERPYSISKLLAERTASQLAEELGVRLLIYRLFNVYGPGQSASFLIPTTIENILRGRPIALRMPHAERDFVHVDDVVSALMLGVDYEGRSEIVNVGTGIGTRVESLVKQIAELLHREANVETGLTYVGEPGSSVANIERARVLLGWSPTISLEEGLRSTIDSGS